MGKQRKTYEKMMSGKSDNNIDFNDMNSLLSYLGFMHKKTTGDHFIYYYEDIPENINIQPTKDNMAKAYQVKQIRNFLKDNDICFDEEV